MAATACLALQVPTPCSADWVRMYSTAAAVTISWRGAPETTHCAVAGATIGWTGAAVSTPQTMPLLNHP